MNELFQGLDYVRTYIDDLLCITNNTFEDHLEKLEQVFSILEQAGLKVNAKKSLFAQTELEYLGYWISQKGIKLVSKRFKPCSVSNNLRIKELQSFVGIINYYCNMWIQHSYILAPLASLTSKTTSWR